MADFFSTRKAIWLIALFAFSLVVAACGGDDDGGDTTTTVADTGDTTTTIDAGTDAPTTTADAGTDATTTTAGGDAMAGLSGLTKVDDSTFTIELSAPDPEFLLRLSYAAYYPMPSVAMEDPAAFEENPIGNGPFMMDGAWEHDIRIPMVANPDYAGDNQPQLDSLEFRIYADTNTAYTDVLAGNLDFLKVVPTDFAGSYQADFPDRNAEFFDTSFTYLGFPSYVEELTLDHRRALSMAVDRELIMETIFAGTRDAAASVIPPVLFGRDNVCENWNYNPDEARTLWEAAGDPGPLTVWFNSGAGHDAWVEAVVNQWGQNLGLDTASVTFESLDFAEYLPVVDAGELTGPFRLGWGQDYPSPYNFLFPLYHSSNFAPVGSNATQYANPDFDAALAEGQAAFAESGDIEDGLVHYYAAEDILCEDVPVMPVYFGKTQSVWAEGIDNVLVDSYRDLDYTRVTSDDGTLSHQISEPEHLLPTTTNESEGIAVLKALFTGLIGFDAETGEPFEAHAESVTTEDGGLTWTVVLKDGWTFHNGEPVTADSYINAWSFGATGANGQQNNSFYSSIVGYDELNAEG